MRPNGTICFTRSGAIESSRTAWRMIIRSPFPRAPHTHTHTLGVVCFLAVVVVGCRCGPSAAPRALVLTGRLASDASKTNVLDTTIND
jgi:hypothetical protein